MRGPRGIFLAASFTLLLGGCDSADQTEPRKTEDPNRIEVAGLWAGSDEDGREERLVCLKLVEPDSAVSIEVVEVDTLAGNGSFITGRGTWSYRPPRVEVQLTDFADPRGIPRVNAEVNATGQMLLLRVSYRQGDQFALTMERAVRCGRIPG